MTSSSPAVSSRRSRRSRPLLDVWELCCTKRKRNSTLNPIGQWSMAPSTTGVATRTSSLFANDTLIMTDGITSGPSAVWSMGSRTSRCLSSSKLTTARSTLYCTCFLDADGRRTCTTFWRPWQRRPTSTLRFSHWTPRWTRSTATFQKLVRRGGMLSTYFEVGTLRQELQAPRAKRFLRRATTHHQKTFQNHCGRGGLGLSVMRHTRGGWMASTSRSWSSWLQDHSSPFRQSLPLRGFWPQAAPSSQSTQPRHLTRKRSPSSTPRCSRCCGNSPRLVWLSSTKATMEHVQPNRQGFYMWGCHVSRHQCGDGDSQRHMHSGRCRSVLTAPENSGRANWRNIPVLSRRGSHRRSLTALLLGIAVTQDPQTLWIPTHGLRLLFDCPMRSGTTPRCSRIFKEDDPTHVRTTADSG